MVYALWMYTENAYVYGRLQKNHMFMGPAMQSLLVFFCFCFFFFGGGGGGGGGGG